MPSPIITASPGSAPTAWAASTRRQGLRLADRDRPDARGGLHGRDHRAGTRHQAGLGRVDRVAVRDDEQGARARRLDGHGQPPVRHVRIEPDDDRVRATGRGVAVDPLGFDAGGCLGRRDDLEPDILELPAEAGAAECQHAAGPRVPFGQPQGGRPGRADDPFRADRGAHRGQAIDVVRPVVHRVVRDVDDVVAQRGARGEHRRDPGHRRRAAVDHAVEVDQKQHRRIVAAVDRAHPRSYHRDPDGPARPTTTHSSAPSGC